MCTGKTEKGPLIWILLLFQCTLMASAAVEVDHARFLGSCFLFYVNIRLSSLQWQEENEGDRTGCETLQPFSGKRLHLRKKEIQGILENPTKAQIVTLNSCFSLSPNVI